jgi:hypothetical protein
MTCLLFIKFSSQKRQAFYCIGWRQKRSRDEVMKEYGVEIKPGVVTTLQLTDDHAKRMGVFKEDKKTATSDSKASEKVEGTTPQTDSNKELTAAEIRRQNAAAKKAAKEEADAAKAAAQNDNA